MKRVLLIGAISVSVGGGVYAANETQVFDDAGSAAAAGWTEHNSRDGGNDFGFSATDNTGGVSGAGEAGGFMIRSGVQTYYADTSIGLLSLDQPISYAGEFAYTAEGAGYQSTGFEWIHGFFDRSNTDPARRKGSYAGFALNERSSSSSSVRIGLMLNSQNGTGLGAVAGIGPDVVSDQIVLDLGTAYTYTWTYDPSGGTSGLVTLEFTRVSDNSLRGTMVGDLTATQRAEGATFNSFGITNEFWGGSGSTADNTLTAFVDNLDYTINPAIPPKTWIAQSGDWNSASNWLDGIPNALGTSALFGGSITSAATVYTNAPVTVAGIKFDNAHSYVITGAGSLTIDNGSGAGSIEVAQGGHKIALPLTFASDSAVTVASGAGLLISDATTIKAGKTVTKNGNVVIQAPLTLEAGASLVLASGPTTAFGAPSLGTGAKIDVKTNSMTVDYRGQASPAATIKAQLASGYASGAWNGEGINTSSAVANQTALGWKDDAASQSILVKYTYYGDANLDGQVDISDLGALATAWQTSAVWSQGDFDYSGFVDISDLGKLATNWQLGVGNPLGPSFDEALASVGLAGVSVPEPTMLGLLGLCLAGVSTRRFRRGTAAAKCA